MTKKTSSYVDFSLMPGEGKPIRSSLLCQASLTTLTPQRFDWYTLNPETLPNECLKTHVLVAWELLGLENCSCQLWKTSLGADGNRENT